MTFHSHDTSVRRLKDVHPDLVKVVYAAVEMIDAPVLVVDGKRTIAQQRKHVRNGKSKTMDSRHLTGHAVDLVAMDPDKKGKEAYLWHKPHSTIVADAMQKAADDLDVEIDRGYDWGWDAPHFELDWNAYPKQDTSWHNTPMPAKVAKKATKAPVSAVGGAAGLVAVLTGYVESGFSWLKGVAVYLTDLTPVKTLFVQAGANLQALTIGGIILAGTVVAKRMLEDDD